MVRTSGSNQAGSLGYFCVSRTSGQKRSRGRLTCGRILLVACVAALTGCSLSGPTSIRTSRTNYNAAIAETSSEQLLLNLVRLRYRDVPLFLEVSSVTTSFEIAADGSATASITTPDIDLLTLRSGLRFSERPSVTYLPLQGEQFVRKLMTPLETETLALMYHSGWSIERILKVCVQRLGPLENAPRASGPTPRSAPKYEGFFEATDLLQVLWQRGDLELGLSAEEGSSALVIRFNHDASRSSEVQRLKELLQLPAGTELRGLTASQTEITGEGVGLVTRSIMASMFFLSQGVIPPDRDVELGNVTLTLDEAGAPFDWLRITGGLMHIESGSAAPETAYVAVRYRKTWFWIRDNDLDSKATFALLGQLLELQSGGVEGTKPVLTLPIGV